MMLTQCTRPRLAVAVNLAQLEAFFSHSRFSLSRVSEVVPKCMRPLAMMVALWQTDPRLES